jgi:hypothetical protein
MNVASNERSLEEDAVKDGPQQHFVWLCQRSAQCLSIPLSSTTTMKATPMGVHAAPALSTSLSLYSVCCEL